ncbi:MAG TPA: hypothetical protein VIG99_16795 [Myxococcaceae bacterium]|jgi:hypothetical protein
MTQPAANTYFDLFCDMSAPKERWYLDGPYAASGELLGDVLTSGRPYEGAVPVICSVAEAGPELELTMTEEVVPIVNERVAGIFKAHAGQDAQIIPARVQGSNTQLFAVNVLASPDCIDQDKKDQGLQIDPARAGGHAIFRPKGRDGSVIVAGPLADALRTAGVRCQLTPVS